MNRLPFPLAMLLAITSIFTISSISPQLQGTFTYIYNTGLWTDPEKESVSGEGSKIDATMVIRRELPRIIKKFNITSLLDIPCGDFNWMKTTNLELTYVGADIVYDLVEKNQRLYANKNRNFLHLDATSDQLPIADMILCRDCLAHLSLKSIVAAIKNFKRSGAKYLLTSNFNGGIKNTNIPDGDWQPLNLLLPPFSFPQPLVSINEQSPRGVDKMYNKHLILWDLSEIDVEHLDI